MIWLIIGAAGALLFAMPAIAIGHVFGLVLRHLTKRP